MHGWPQNWWLWREVIPALSQRFRVIAPDLRGHGWTDTPASGYDKEQLASDLLALLDALEIRRVTWIGHDWGGWAGFLACLRSPKRFYRMLAICIPHPWSPPDPRRLALMASYQLPISLPFAGPALAKPLSRVLVAGGRGGERLRPSDVEIFTSRISPAVTVAMYRTFVTRELPAIVRGRYGRDVLEVPVTLIVGDRDPVSGGLAAGAVPGQPQLRVVTLAGVGHWVPEQRPQAIIDWA